MIRLHPGLIVIFLSTRAGNAYFSGLLLRSFVTFDNLFYDQLFSSPTVLWLINNLAVEHCMSMNMMFVLGNAYCCSQMSRISSLSTILVEGVLDPNVHPLCLSNE